MDKQQAIAYIHQMLDNDASREEIVRGLAEQLRAPETIVSKFVAQTEAEYRSKQELSKPQPLPAPISPQPVKLPPWLEEMSIGSQPRTDGNPPVEPQPDWMQRLAQSAIPAASEVASNTPESNPNWAQPLSQPETSSPSTSSPASPSWENEAKAFVLTQLQYERLHSDIADELVDRVGIPLTQAQNFVTAVATQIHTIPQQKITNAEEAADFVRSEYAKGRPKLEITNELATRTGEPQNQTAKFVTLTIANIEKSQAQSKPPISSDQTSIDLNNQALVKYVVSELAKNRKRSDIVMAICERTGAHWSEVQKFVGQVNAEQRTKINARKNILIVPMCIGAIIFGFVFTIVTAYPMLYLLTGRWEEFYSMTRSMGSLSDYINAAPYIFGTGIVLIAGGIIGLVLALQSQME
jgi:hypothetical protein